MYSLETSCAIQVRAQSGGGELIPVPKEIIESAYGQGHGGRETSAGEGRLGVAGAASAPRSPRSVVPDLRGGAVEDGGRQRSTHTGDGMIEREIRERIHELMEAGALPTTLADGSLVSESGRGVPAQVHVGTVDLESCAICGEPGPQLSYYYPGGWVLCFHAHCDLLWQEERAR